MSCCPVVCLARKIYLQLQVTGFPTITLLKADGSLVPYSGDRSEADLVKFVEGAVSGVTASKLELDDEDDSEDSSATMTDEL